MTGSRDMLPRALIPQEIEACLSCATPAGKQLSVSSCWRALVSDPGGRGCAMIAADFWTRVVVSAGRMSLKISPLAITIT